jgi:hypothetical protein
MCIRLCLNTLIHTYVYAELHIWGRGGHPLDTILRLSPPLHTHTLSQGQFLNGGQTYCTCVAPQHYLSLQGAPLIPPPPSHLPHTQFMNKDMCTVLCVAVCPQLCLSSCSCPVVVIQLWLWMCCVCCSFVDIILPLRVRAL